MAHFNDFKIQLITSPAGTHEAMRCVEAAPSLSFLNLFARCNQMRRKCSDPWGDKVPWSFPWWGGKVGRELVLGVSVQAQHLPGLAWAFLPRGVCGRAPAAANVSSWAPKGYPGRSQPNPHASLCLGGAWGMTFEGEFLLDVSDGF